MAFCTRCGSPVNGEAQFCPNCGQLRNLAAVVQVPVASAPKARKIAVPPMPEESPEERRRRCERTPPVLHANKKIDGQLAYIVWMMRLAFLSIALMIAWKPSIFLKGIDGLMILFILCFCIGSAEFIYWRGRRSTGEAILTPSSIILSPVSVYGGLFFLRKRIIPKDEVIGVEVARGKDAPPTLLDSYSKGVPTSLVLHLKNGKLISLQRRAPEEVLAAAEYAGVVWEVAKEDEAQRVPARSTEIYREFPNDHRSNQFWIVNVMLAGMATFFIAMVAWGARNGVNTAEALVDLILLGMAASMLVLIKMTYDRDHAVRSVRVESEGVTLTLKRTARFVPWAGIRSVRVIDGNAVSRERDRIAVLQISKTRFYFVTREIGLAIEQAYRERTGKEVPDPTTVVPKKGVISQADANLLKYEHPALYRKNLIISAALMANGFFLLMNVVFRSPLLIMVGAVLLIILLFFRLQISKEMREFLGRRSKGADRPGA